MKTISGDYPGNNIMSLGYPSDSTSYNMERHVDPVPEMQAQAVSDRASILIITSLVSAPQGTAGETVVADRLMDNFAPRPGSATGIGIREVALLSPDPALCTEKINAIHDAFGIYARATPELALKRVYGAAASALEEICIVTSRIAQEQGFPAPLDAVSCSSLPDVFSGEWSINRHTAYALHDFLSAHPDVRERVAAHIKSKADEIRRRSKAQQAFAKSLDIRPDTP